MVEQKTAERSEAAQEKPAVAVEKAQDEDYKVKYESLQGEHQKLVEQHRSAQQTLDTLDQYGAIDWAKITNPKSEPDEKSTETETSDIENRLRSIEEQADNKVLALQFQVEHPDLKEYRDALVVPTLMRVRRKYPRKSKEEVLELTATEVREFLTKQEEKFLAKQKAEKAKEDAIKASGLGSTGKTTPEEEVVDEDELRQKYIERRREKRRKRIGLA